MSRHLRRLQISAIALRVDNFGRQSSAEILGALTKLRAKRVKMLERDEVSKSSNSRQSVFDSLSNLAGLAVEEERLMGLLNDALCREGVYPGGSSIYRVFPTE